ncbi:hypothetical protein BKA66DRAFT_258838 [Pyrenochaeta sp. MPI-SDFR-AT-0127]|nr:hypothetical protein BKA66DRAFT_258838 [Pyrenochaeta sp. MPI-SDFR-AT-0127]
MEHHEIDAISLTYLNPRWNTRVGRLRPGNDRNNDAFDGSLSEQDRPNDPNALLEL